MSEPTYETFEDQIEDVVQTMLQSWAEYSKDPEKHDRERFERELEIEAEPMPIEESLRLLAEQKESAPKRPAKKVTKKAVAPVPLSKEDLELLGNKQP